ncbi:hypothetical protein LZC95_12995 [Pendulispora brunnea]|uniref:Uncharacterized protein n=1 Tax=Pendulispora brunnea TaxID=2905690 RepID=A0ABZ2KKB8_9BACT
MATTSKESAPPVRTLADLRKDDLVPEEGDWSGPKLAVLGVISLGIALAFLYVISPYSGVILP